MTEMRGNLLEQIPVLEQATELWCICSLDLLSMFLPGIIIDSVNQVAFKSVTAWWI